MSHQFKVKGIDKLKKENITIAGVPAVLWGEGFDTAFLAVHGLFSHKEDTVIALFAEQAACRGYAAVSIDLSGHGARIGQAPPTAQMGSGEVAAVYRAMQQTWNRVAFFGCSMGAYFGLLALQKKPLFQMLLLSPVADMGTVIEEMLASNSLLTEELAARGEIPLPGGPTLFWADYQWIKENPITAVSSPLCVLCGEAEAPAWKTAAEQLALRSGGVFSLCDGAGHHFHTEKDLTFFQRWLRDSLVNP